MWNQKMELSKNGGPNFRALSLMINMFLELSLRQTVHWFDNGESPEADNSPKKHPTTIDLRMHIQNIPELIIPTANATQMSINLVVTCCY